MGPLTASAAVDVPRERAFDFLCDLANRPAFMEPFACDLRLERLDSAGVGAAARLRIPGKDLWLETVITDAERPHRILERGSAGRLGRIGVSTAWELTDGPWESSCEVKVVYWTEPTHPLDRLRDHLPGAHRFYRRGWSGALRRLKELLESGREPERVAVAGADRIPGAG